MASFGIFYDQVSILPLKSPKQLKEGYAELYVTIRKTPLGYVFAEYAGQK
jgi:hypothetical protein